MNMTFSSALEILVSSETKLRRKSWFQNYFVYIDNRDRTKFMFVYDRPFFTDADLLADDWEVFVKS